MLKTTKSTLFATLLLFTTFILAIGIAPNFLRIVQETQQAREAYEMGQFDSASYHMASLAKKLAWRSDLWEVAAHYALLAEDTEAAIQYLERAREASRSSKSDQLFDGLTLEGWIDLGDAYRKSGDLITAIETYQKALKFNNQSILLHERLWEGNVSVGDYTAATNSLQVLTTLLPDNADYQYHLGLMLAAYTPESAIAPLQKAATLDAGLAPSANAVRGSILAASLTEDPAFTLVMAGRSLANIGEWDLAAEAFQRSIQLNPEYAEAWAFLGEALQHISMNDANISMTTGRASDGYEEINKALALDPNSLAAHLILGLYWSRQENFTLAEEAIRKAIKLYPEEAILQVELGRILASAGHLEHAYDAYREALSLEPENAAYLRHLADFSLLYNYQVKALALPAARKTIILAPTDPQNLTLMAQVLIRLGDLANAERFLHRALAMNSSYAPAHLHLGMIYLLSDNTVDAMNEFKVVLTLDPNSHSAEQANRLIELYFP